MTVLVHLGFPLSQDLEAHMFQNITVHSEWHYLLSRAWSEDVSLGFRPIHTKHSVPCVSLEPIRVDPRPRTSLSPGCARTCISRAIGEQKCLSIRAASACVGIWWEHAPFTMDVRLLWAWIPWSRSFVRLVLLLLRMFNGSHTSSVGWGIIAFLTHCQWITFEFWWKCLSSARTALWWPVGNNFCTLFSQSSRADLEICEDFCGSPLVESGGGDRLLKIREASNTVVPTTWGLRYQNMSRKLMRKRIFSKSSFGYCRCSVGSQVRILVLYAQNWRTAGPHAKIIPSLPSNILI